MSNDEAVATEPYDDRLVAFWEVAKRRAKLSSLPGYFGPSALESVPPPSWSLGACEEEADAAVATLLVEDRLAVTEPRSAYAEADAALPEVGTLGIVLDGSGIPQVLVVTEEVVAEGDEVTESLRVLYRDEPTA